MTGRPPSPIDSLQEWSRRGARALILCLCLAGCGDEPAGATASAGPVEGIALYRVPSDDGRPTEPRRDFAIGERVRAVVTLAEGLRHADSAGAWHILWLRPNGRRLFLKRTGPGSEERPRRLRSSIRLRARYGPGEYRLQVYRLRLLVAETRFTVRAEPADGSGRGSRAGRLEPPADKRQDGPS